MLLAFFLLCYNCIRVGLFAFLLWSETVDLACVFENALHAFLRRSFDHVIFSPLTIGRQGIVDVASASAFLAPINMTILVLRSTWSHVGDKSGFHLSEILRSVLPFGQVQELLVPPIDPPIPVYVRFARKIGLRSLSFLGEWCQPDLGPARGSPAATIRHRLVARKALAILEQNNDSVLLLPVAEEEFSVDFAAAQDEVKKRIFVCFHQPPGAFRLHWKRFEDLDSLAGIFCLGEAQASYFKSVSRSPVHLIRHGVRYDFFCPPNDSSLRKGKRLLFVGQWLRDFATLADSMELIWSCRPNVHLDCVIPFHARNTEPLRRLAMDARVTWFAELTNEELRDLYQAADLLFLPLLDAVANNSVLESLASGLPVISTDIGATAEYVPSGAGQLCQPHDARSHATAVVNWLDNKARRAEAEGIARSFALENFDWATIGKHLASCIIN